MSGFGSFVTMKWKKEYMQTISVSIPLQLLGEKCSENRAREQENPCFFFAESISFFLHCLAICIG